MIVGVMGRERFERAMREIRTSGPASSGDDLLGMEIDFCHDLGDPAYADGHVAYPWRNMTVSHGKGDEWLIEGQARGRVADSEAIASALARTWEDSLRYPYREAHTIVQTPNEVALLAVTQMDSHQLWVTAKITVLLSDG
jgi:hypothetical protein